MSKKMTPCEELGYEVGDEFTVIEKSYIFNAGDVVTLQSDDGSTYPFFTSDKVKGEYPNGVACFIANIKPMEKLKPAKQALADAIHQGGGWVEGGDWHKNGELPPVGEVCEWLECKQTGWQEVIVAGYYMNAAWIVPKGKEPITVFNPTGFRALRTEREKAIDEMMRVAAENWGNLQDCCERLYEYGYRKEAN